VQEAREIDGRRRFPFRPDNLSLATMGRSVVISCSGNRMDWVTKQLSALDRDQSFSSRTVALLNDFVGKENQYMAGPDLRYLCSQDSLRKHATPAGIEVALLQSHEIRELYGKGSFPNAIGYSIDTPRPRLSAAVAKDGEQIVGVAGASADCDRMWQVGIDVVPQYQGRGVGKCIVAALTSAILQKGKIPYYSTGTSNVRSQALAVSVGYWPAWTEMYARYYDEATQQATPAN